MNRSMTLKLLVIAAITGVILIALTLVNGTITERQTYRQDAIKSIEASYAGPQSLVGPVLVRPYTETIVAIEDPDGKGKRPVEHVNHLNALTFPHAFELHGKLIPNERRHGLYTVTVYELASHISGSLDFTPPAAAGMVTWGEPYLALSVQDVRGIVGTPSVTINNTPATMLQDVDTLTGWQPNLRIPLRTSTPASGHIDFAMDMALAGTEQLSIAPVGNSNHVELVSTWHSPLFDGQFLPRSRSVGANGFNAVWDISSLAAGTQMQLQTQSTKPIDLLAVSLLQPIDPYKLSDRATKYGILFVLLTFSGFFLFEMLKHLPIHPVQYLLVGFGLAIFFLLLISFSEHMPFALAYSLSSAGCIGLLTFYLLYVLRSASRGLSFGAMLTTLYSAVYGLLISEDNSLILGSLLLFAVLTVVMVITRNVDWYKLSAKPATPQPYPPIAPMQGFRMSE